MTEIKLGDVTVTRVEEMHGPIGMTPQDFFPGSPEEVWEANHPLLVPDFLDAGTNIINAANVTWVLRSEGKTILIDTGVGNDKERPNVPGWGHLDTDFLLKLARAGVQPEDVDLVINTHLHGDHVGWNTQLEDGTWVPTFPNAAYLMSRTDFDFWNPANGHESVFALGNLNVFEDSVAPIHAAGQAVLWEDHHVIDANLRLDLAPGHTPGSSILTLASGSDRAVFIGDVLQNPLQFGQPDLHSCFCEDPATARATRRRILGWAADHRVLVLPGHLAGHSAAEITRDGDVFTVTGWAPFDKLGADPAEPLRR